jgi:hypothetical protein
MISAALSGCQVWRGEQGIHLRLLKVCDQRFWSLLERHSPNLSAPFDHFGSMQADEPSQGVDGGQSLVAGGNCALSLLLQFI